MIVFMGVGGINTGGLSATMTASGTSGNTSGFAISPAVGSLSASALPCGLSINGLFDNTGTNKFVLSIADPNNLLAQMSLVTVTMNSITFNAEAATFSPSASNSASWSWNNGGVRVTGAGRGFVIA